MVLDCHVHIDDKEVNSNELVKRMGSAGIDGGILLSLAPNSFIINNNKAHKTGDRLDNLFSWTGGHNNLYPFFWIDPLEEDAVEQVEEACRRGVKGFKIICNHFYPGDKKAMQVYKAVARRNRPILFHSGILWDGQVSSKYNRPLEFEDLLEVEGLRFALAHVSWPWCDENLALYGKFQNTHARRRELSVEMFIDLTPGTPPVYREEVLTRLHTIGYDVENNVMFGTDCEAHEYDAEYAAQWISRDNGIYDKLGLDSKIRKKIYSDNLIRFLGGNLV